MDNFFSDIDERYEEISDESKLQFIKLRLSETEDPVEKASLKKSYELLLSNISLETNDHVIILLHGMNTLAAWQQTMKEELESNENIKVLPFSYGFYGPFKFFFPKKFKHEPIEEIKKNIAVAFKRNPKSKFSLVAHSFGSFVTSEILSLDESIGSRISNIILCGSIVKRTYAWERFPEELLILNEVGSSDIWPVLAAHANEEYGSTGTFGFNGPVVRDRFHSIKHSDYFKIEFIKDFWVPFFIHGHIKPSHWGKSDRKYPLIIEKIHALPTWVLFLIITVVLVASISAIIIFFYWLYLKFN